MTKQNYETPCNIFNSLNKEFRFMVDACADKTNHKLKTYWDKQQNGLVQNWACLVVFVNPPYENIKPWVEKAINSSNIEKTTVVMLLRNDCSTAWYKLAWDNAHEIRQINHRVNFTKTAPPFPCSIFIFKPRKRRRKNPKVRLISFK